MAALAGEPVASGLELPSVGLSTVRAQRFGRVDLPNANSDGNDLFGIASAAGDFNGDGVDDLATGAPGNDGPQPHVDNCGEVVVRYGIAGRGLDRNSAPTVLGQFTTGGAEVGDLFGLALASCDFNGDGFGDLAVGVPFEDVISSGFEYENAGVVSIFLGSNAGLAATPSITVGDSSAVGLPTAEMYVGRILACGDFNGDAFAELVVGVPDRTIAGLTEAGHLRIFRGAASGTFAGAYAVHQDTTGIDDSANLDDRFGSALAVGDFDADGFDDVVVSVPGENFGSFAPAAVHVIFGASGAGGGLGATGRDQLIQGPSEAQADTWGKRLATGDFDGDGLDDLVIGVPWDDIGEFDSGAAYVLLSTGGVFDLATAERLTSQDIFGVGESQENEYFGDALAVGDFNGDHVDDLAIGIPGEFLDDFQEGAVTVLLAQRGVGLHAQVPHSRQFDHGLEEIPSGNVTELVLWGSALTTGDFDGDGFGDLAVGARLEGDVPLVSVGSVTALYSALFADGFGNARLDFSYWSGTVTPQ